MARIYLSPSTQEHNAYAGGSNEEVEMRDLVAVIAPLLLGHTVRVGGTVSAATNVADSNAWNADWHIAVHSNAGGGVGTEVWHYPGSKQGERMAKAIYARLAPVTASPDRGVKSSAGYIETRGPKSPAVIIEAAFHDKLVDANEIKTHHAEYGAAIASGILDVVGGGVVTPPPAPKPPVTPPRPPMPVLRKYSVGGAVRTLQAELNAHVKAGLRVDGVFGGRTLAAVKAWQKRCKLTADGVVGPATWKSLGR